VDPSLLGRVLLIVGLAIAAVGGFLALGGRLPLGHLPGDISSPGFSFPVTSCILVSLVLSGLLTLIVNVFFRS
jgi:hypothetical protein